MPDRRIREQRFAERTLDGRDDRGEREVVTVWVDRLDGGLWSVGRAVGLDRRESPAPRPGDIVRETYDLDDALRTANETLEADVVAGEDSDAGRNDRVRAFTRRELEARLERWFFDHA